MFDHFDDCIIAKSYTYLKKFTLRADAQSSWA